MKLIAVIFLATAGYLLISGAYSLWKTINVAKFGITTKAIVVSNELQMIETRGGSNNFRRKTPAFVTGVQFSHDGRSFTSALNQSLEPMVVGRKLPIKFLPDAPEQDVHIEGDIGDYAIPIIKLFFGVAILLQFLGIGKVADLSIALLIASLFFFIGVLWSAETVRMFFTYRESTTATFVESDKVSDSQGRFITLKKVEYTYKDSAYQAYIENENGKGANAGNLKVYFDPKDPWSATADSLLEMLLAGLFVTAIGGFGVWNMIFRAAL